MWERIENLGDFFSVIDALTTDDLFWFRGHRNAQWPLIPSALRYDRLLQREAALNSIEEFKRIAELKAVRPPGPEERLKWIQLAQHYGLPTRLLDWTESSIIGLYFACERPDEIDGIVYALDPTVLNEAGPAADKRVLTASQDQALLDEYLDLGGRSLGAAGRPPLAVNPVWNSDRLVLQRGAFTLHGSLFELDTGATPSLIGIPILAEFKRRIRKQLGRIGVDQMTIFPELEHTCTYLRDRIEAT